MFNEGPGGYSYGGADTLVALDCAVANNPADPGCWGVKLTLNGGLLQGSWSLEGFASSVKDAENRLSVSPTLPSGIGVPVRTFNVHDILSNQSA